MFGSSLGLVRDFDNALVSSVDLESIGLRDISGMAFDPTNGHLHIYSSVDKELAELTQAGEFLAGRDFSEFEFSMLRGMVFSPSGDMTDDPSRMNLYIADSGPVTNLEPADQFTPNESIDKC